MNSLRCKTNSMFCLSLNLVLLKVFTQVAKFTTGQNKYPNELDVTNVF